MWMAVFVWCLFSSAVIYSTAAVLAFAALRKHSLGRFYSVMILVMGLTVTHAAVGFTRILATL